MKGRGLPRIGEDAASPYTKDGDDEAMRRIAAGLAWVGLTAGAGAALGQDAPPPLTPPLVGPVSESAPKPRPAPIPAPTPAPGQVLIVPGITTPRTGVKPRVTAPALRDSDPPLELPLEFEPAKPATTRSAAKPVFTGTDPFASEDKGRPPSTLESASANADNDPSALTPPISATAPHEDPAPRGPIAPAQAPRRRPFGLLGRFLPPGSPLERRYAPDDGVRVAPRNDPENDAALKRRIERQIRDNFGTRVQSYEVQVVNGEIAIRARASRFWFRRGVQMGMEALPELRGYRARVEVVD